MVSKVPVRVWEGRTCVFCRASGPYKIVDGRLKCKRCKRIYSLSKLRKDLEVLRYFALGLSANNCADELELNYKTVHRRYMIFRRKIMDYTEETFQKLSGELELDETYFGGKKKGKRGRGAFNKTCVFGILERNGIVYTKVVEDVSAKTLMQVIEEKTEKGSVYYTDCFKSYKSLTRFGKHNRINKQHAWAKGRNHINGIEGFWSFAKERFHKYHGVKRNNYNLYLKELEFRFNNRNTNLFNNLINIIYK